MGFSNNPFTGAGEVSFRDPAGNWQAMGLTTGIKWPSEVASNMPAKGRSSTLTARVFVGAGNVHLRKVSPYRKALLDEMTRLQRKGGGNIWNAKPSVYRKWLKLNRYQSWCM